MQSSIWHCRCRQHLAAYPRVLDGQPTRFLALLLTRFTMRSASLRSRWALTPPFHPYLQSRRFAFCCTVCSLTAPGRYPASCPMELGLSSRALENQRQSDCFYDSNIKKRNQRVSRLLNSSSEMKPPSLSSPPSSSPSSTSSEASNRASRCSLSSLSS